MEIWDSSFKRFAGKYDKIKSELDYNDIKTYAKTSGVTEEALEQGLLSNSSNFQTLAFNYSKTVMPGKVNSPTYAAVVAKIAEHFGISFTVYVGFALPEDSSNYDSWKKEFEEMKANGDEKAGVPNHVYININGKDYEYFNGNTANITHFNCIPYEG